MNNMAKQGVRGRWLLFAVILVLGSSATAGYIKLTRPPPSVEESPSQAASVPRVFGTEIQIQYFCGRCHAYPNANTFPKWAWRQEIEQAYKFFAQSKLPMQAPPIEQVIAYYEERAPIELALPVPSRITTTVPLTFRCRGVSICPEAPIPAVSNVNLVRLFDKNRLDILACDMRAGLVLAFQPYAPVPAWRVLGKVPNPAHAEVVDLDGDGIPDILVACLGSLGPTDERTGSVIWLRGSTDGSFTTITLLKDVGRVADVQAADFRGIGKKDLVVAVFGWRNTGEVLYLQNQTTDWSRPIFVPQVLDDRHGAIHVPVGDINGDGRPDFVALISQEHETVVAFLNDGDGRFRKEAIYTGPHPAYGSTGIQLVDLNGDGKLDVLYTNGDSFEKPAVLKPYHGVQWLENQGRFPFVHHWIAAIPGVHRAVAADFRNCGRPDIVAVSHLPRDAYPHRGQLDLDSVVYLEQASPGQFVRHSLEKEACDHVTCAAGDLDGSGRIDLVTGNFMASGVKESIRIWKNSGTASNAADAR